MQFLNSYLFFVILTKTLRGHLGVKSSLKFTRELCMNLFLLNRE